jgi:glycosyltransferase involved in cell wall biosynthesis
VVELAAPLRRSLVRAVLAGSAAVTRRMLRTGSKDFRRIVIVAPLARNNGISSGARLQHAALRALGVDAELVDGTASLRRPWHRIPHEPGSAYIFHCGGPQTASLIAGVLPHAARAYRIGYWAWELPDPPRDWGGCDALLDEIWTPSSFAQASLRRMMQKPVAVAPHPVPAHMRRSRRPGDPFTVLAFADSRSSWARKNPLGALQAFRTAFAGSADARMILKLGGNARDMDAFEADCAGLLRGGNISVIRGHLEADELADLFRASDVLLSLHRAEGYGLPMHEAMGHGVPVVATGWSGNMDFMSAADSCLVPYRLVPVSDAAAIYGDSVWAEPDLDAAAAHLRRLAGDAECYDRLAAAAHRRALAATPRFPFLPVEPPETEAMASLATA